MTLFTKLDDKKRMRRNAGKYKVFSSLMMNGNALEPFVTSYQYVELLVNIPGNPRVKISDPYPYPSKPLPA